MIQDAGCRMHVETLIRIMKKRFVFLFVIIFSAGSAALGQTVSVRGKLFDKESGRAISNGAITINPGNRSTITDMNGEYLLNCSPGIKQLSTQILGYRQLTIEFSAKSDTVINLYVQVLPFELDEVTVTGEQVKNVRITQHGNLVVTPAAMHETPKLFSEPDLLKSLQLMPGVITGKEGSSDIYVRGGSAGQNIILSNGCYFFLPGHFLGMISPIDLDFLENSELFKDYFPAELGGGASSVISLRFKEPETDTLHAQLRLGMLSSGITAEKQVPELNLNIAAGLKHSNYWLYYPFLNRILSEDVVKYLPHSAYKFFDGFLKVSHSSEKLGTINYLFFGNYDKGKQENETSGLTGDTILFNLDRLSNDWKSQIHALEWEPPVKNKLKWKFDLNYNRLSIRREAFHQTEKRVSAILFDVIQTAYAFSPTVNILGYSATVSGNSDKFSWSAGLSGRLRNFSPNITVNHVSWQKDVEHSFGEGVKVAEPAAFFSSTYHISRKLQLDAGLRVSGAFLKDAHFIIPEPRVRLSYNPGGAVSPHITYVRLSQFDHSVEGTNAGLRSMLWIPVSKEFKPEVTDVISAGFQGQIKEHYVWSIDAYYKKIDGMLDYKSGASFVYDTTFAEILDVIEGWAYGLETGIIKTTGKLTGTMSYTYSRSKQEWSGPQGLIWIPANSDRPHNFNLAMRYHLNDATSFGLNWVYASGLPATIYMHETSYGKYYNTKNNIRYFDYHRMDISLRQRIIKRKYSMFIDLDLFNVYNHNNTFYFKEVFDWYNNVSYFKSISLFPIMPTLTVTIRY